MIEKLKKILETGGYSCVIAQGEEIRTFTQRGIADLYDIMQQEPDLLRGALIADKVVGKGAAALMVSGGIKMLYAGVISEPALSLFEQAGIPVRFKTSVPHIINRDRTDRCPLEKSCDGKDTVADILPVIGIFITKIRSKATL